MVHLDIEFGGTVIASVPIELTENGYVARALVSALTPSSQVGHVWLTNSASTEVVVGAGTSAVNTEVDQTLKVVFRADSIEDLVRFKDFVQLRTAIVMWLYVDDGNSGALISFAELEVPHSSLFVSFAELEVPIPLRLVVSHAELEVPHSSLFVSFAELEVPLSSLFVSFAELQVPDV